MRRLAAAAGLATLALLAVPAAAQAAQRPGSMVGDAYYTHHRAGTCTVRVTYNLQNVNEIFQVESTSDSCSGGGQEKYQAELQCSGGPGPYFYGAWKTGGDVSSAADGNCAATGHHLVAGYLRVNENSPYRVTCWVPGDNLVGTCSASGH